MFAITGITGQVGGVVARIMLASGSNVRAVVRNADKAKNWAAQGCEIAVAEINDATALEKAFTGVDGVFILLPPTFDPSPGYPEARHTIGVIRTALAAARPPKVVCLSTIGANATQPNLLNQLGILEQELGTLPMPIAFLRAAWFMENAAWDIAPARKQGVIPTFLQPLDKPVPMVATADVGRVAAELLQEEWTGRRVINLEGPRRITPNEVAASFANILGKSVRAEIVPRDTWQDLFTSQGMKNPIPRMQMLDGFNEGWIEFDQGEAYSRKGSVTIDTVLKSLIEKEAQT
ncbi:MAG TPA: NmrA family NAD(P)-binding protein [Herminiimonas sp.]|nr:NmrA family NAD(P)-binding protein [Herminiimonas sp.]